MLVRRQPRRGSLNHSDSSGYNRTPNNPSTLSPMRFPLDDDYYYSNFDLLSTPRGLSTLSNLNQDVGNYGGEEESLDHPSRGSLNHNNSYEYNTPPNYLRTFSPIPFSLETTAETNTNEQTPDYFDFYDFDLLGDDPMKSGQDKCPPMSPVVNEAARNSTKRRHREEMIKNCRPICACCFNISDYSGQCKRKINKAYRGQRVLQVGTRMFKTDILILPENNDLPEKMIEEQRKSFQEAQIIFNKVEIQKSVGKDGCHFVQESLVQLCIFFLLYGGCTYKKVKSAREKKKKISVQNFVKAKKTLCSFKTFDWNIDCVKLPPKFYIPLGGEKKMEEALICFFSDDMETCAKRLLNQAGFPAESDNTTPFESFTNFTQLAKEEDIIMKCCDLINSLSPNQILVLRGECMVQQFRKERVSGTLNEEAITLWCHQKYNDVLQQQLEHHKRSCVCALSPKRKKIKIEK